MIGECELSSSRYWRWLHLRAIRSYAGWLALGAAAVLAVMVFGHSLLVHL